MGCDRRVDEIAAQTPKARKRSILVRAGEPTVTDDVGHQDCRELPGLVHEGWPYGPDSSTIIPLGAPPRGAPLLWAICATAVSGREASVKMERRL